jgi:hypothetical protein
MPVIRAWLEKLRSINSLERISAWLTVLWQYTVTAWQLLSRLLRFLLHGILRRVRPPGSNVRRIFRARAYPGSRRREDLVHVPPSYERA